MDSRIFRLSVEELTYILAMTGHRDEARALLNSSFDEEITDDQLEQRMLTAAHGLMARHMLAIGLDGSINMEEETARFAQVLVNADYSLRFSRQFVQGDMAGELAFSVHRSGNTWVEHGIEQGVVHQLQPFEDANRIIANAAEFFEPPREAGRLPSFEAPGSLLEVLANPDPAISHRLRQQNVPADLIPLLAADAGEKVYQGSVMLVEYDENKQAVSNHGLLLLQGPERLWLMIPRVQNGETTLAVVPGDAQGLVGEIQRLISIRG